MKPGDSGRHVRIGVFAATVVIVAATAYVSLAPNANPYGVYSLLAVLAFALEVGDGVSMGFVFLILSLGHLGWIETLLMANTALLLGATVYPARSDPPVLSRSLLFTTLASLSTHLIYSELAKLPGIEVPVPIFAAACVCFLSFHVFDWKGTVLWSLSYYLVAAAISVLVPASMVLPVLLVMMWRAYRAYARRLTRQHEHSSQIANLYLRTVEALAVAIEAREQPVSRRTQRVRFFVAEMARELELPAEQQEALGVASLLYDIGELAIPEHIILKPGPLTDEEFEKVKTHPEVGAAILDQVGFPYPVAPIVRAHHERWNGSGYPYGLKREEIPIGARILALADAVDSLASSRGHRPALTITNAVERVLAGSGKDFDPNLTALLAKRWQKWESQLERQDAAAPDPISVAQREAALLRELSSSLSDSLDFERMCQAAGKALHRMLEFDTLAVWLEDQGLLTAKFVEGAFAPLLSPLSIALGTGVSGRAALTGQTEMNGDPSCENESAAIGPLITPLRWALAAPLASKNFRGALTLYRTDSGIAPGDGACRFTPDDGRMVNTVAPLLATAMAKALRYSEASTRAGADSLTGLPNAAALAARMSALSGRCAVVLCDLDGFKSVNDQFGHLTGNRLLQAIAQGFQRCCRSGDYISRLGGDEFVLLLEHGRPAEIEGRLNQFREMVRAIGRQIAECDVLDASFGTAFHPDDGNSPEQLLALADQRMYACKNQRNQDLSRLERGLRIAGIEEG